MGQTLSGKVALVTGGSRGIGAAIVRRLATDGATVVFTYAASPGSANDLAREIEATGAEVLAIHADSAQPAAVKAAVAETVERFGRIDILVNNAGILTMGLVDDYSLEDFDRMFAINVRAVFVAVQSVLPHMRNGGRIITTGSIVSERTGFPGASVYAMTKGAVASMTRGLARDLGPRGITVNAIAPGPTETDMTADPDVRAIVRPLMSLGRLGTVHEVASLAAYLAGPDAGFVTGASLTIDGGYLA
jgi:3-oxoacyl-[acyl-carrier protein] reductase